MPQHDFPFFIESVISCFKIGDVPTQFQVSYILYCCVTTATSGF